MSKILMVLETQRSPLPTQWVSLPVTPQSRQRAQGNEGEVADGDSSELREDFESINVGEKPQKEINETTKAKNSRWTKDLSAKNKSCYKKIQATVFDFSMVRISMH